MAESPGTEACTFFLVKLSFPDQLYLKNVNQASLSILVIFLFDIVEQLKLRIAIFMTT